MISQGHIHDESTALCDWLCWLSLLYTGLDSGMYQFALLLGMNFDDLNLLVLSTASWVA